MSESKPDAPVPTRFTAILQLGCIVAVFIAVAVRLPAVEMGFYGGVKETLFSTWYGKPALIGALLGAFVTVAQLALVRHSVNRGRARWVAISFAALTVAAGLILAYGAYRVGFVSPLPDVSVQAEPATFIAVIAGVSLAALGATRALWFLAAVPEAAPEGRGRWAPGVVGVTVLVVGLTSGLVLPLIRQGSISPSELDSGESINRDKIIGKWKVTDNPGQPSPPPDDKYAELAMKSMYVYVIFDETGTLTVESGADRPDVLAFMKRKAPEQVFTARMKYKLLAGEDVEIFDMPPRGHPGRFGDKARARVRVRIEGQIMTLLEERGSNRLTKVTDAPFLGTWVVDSTEAFGKNASDKDAGGLKLTFHADKATWHFLLRGEWKSFDGTLRYDPTTEPKEIDISQPNNPGTVALGIYKIDGNTLTISLGAERPKTFDEPSLTKLVFRRE